MLLTDQLQRAVRHHQLGEFAQAEYLYEEVLASHPEQFDALHLLGVLAKQMGNPQKAILYIEQALQVDALQPSAHCNLASAYADLAQHQNALRHYDLALQLRPDYALAWTNRGNTLKAIGALDEALASYAEALKLQPNDAQTLLNRGIVFQLQENPKSALQEVESALRLRADYAEAHCARGAALLSLHQYADALSSLQRALALRPAFPEAWCNQGIAYFRLGDFSSALASFDHAIALQARYAKAHQYRGNTLRQLARGMEAIAAYETALACGAEVEQIQFVLAALGAATPPVSAPATYVTELFDHYADHFDQHLTENLSYTVPQQITAAFAQHNHHLSEKIRIVDVGCGTGLCAPYLKPYASHLVGVDLSPNMLAKAGELHVYDALICAELVSYLSPLRSEFDAIIAADVLVYIGDLSATMQAVANALVTRGMFCFSTENSAAQDYLLQQSSRYAHHADYITRMANEVGFEVQHSQRVPARKEGD
ncbi:MAG: tetratricopeptide repeat protein, partial [Burkholderiaceae bacterium]|nr:tetratricopeptide repeat protein [Burkholderiaceae bacterium]